MQESKRGTLTLNFNARKSKESNIQTDDEAPNKSIQQLMLRQQQIKNNRMLEQRNKFLNRGKKVKDDSNVIEPETQKPETKKEDQVCQHNQKATARGFQNPNREKKVETTKEEKREVRDEKKPSVENKFSDENQTNLAFDKNRNNKVLKTKVGFKKEKTDDFEEQLPEKRSKKDFNDKLNSKLNKYSKGIRAFVFNEEDEEDEDDVFIKRRSTPKNKVKIKKADNQHEKIYHDVNIPDFISISDLADRMSEKKADLVKKLFTMGMQTTANQIIDADTAELLVVEFGHNPVRVSESDVEKIISQQVGTKFVDRDPVVTVMGHVDHGKTSLLDALRSTNIVKDESGGITQHIGASRVEVRPGKFVTFIDTPGHEAFTEMRIRGANITDIVVLVVAADDGIKDQTIEAINHTKAAKVPMIVAINKIDKPGANPDRVKQELLQYDVVTEDFGGDIMSVNISAKDNINLDKLLDTILLQAEMLELKAPIDCPAEGAIIEAKIDLKRGAVASVLVQKGILKIGDIVVAGTSYGKIKKMVDDKHKVQEKVSASMPVEILGLNTVPKAGDTFNVVATEKEARDIISYRDRKEKEKTLAKNNKLSLENMLTQVGSNRKQLSLIIKADVSGSIEAISSSLLKLGNDEVSVKIIHGATGAVNESDITLASVSNALVIGFNVRASSKAVEMAKDKCVEIRYHSIIYDIIDDVKNILNGLLEPDKKDNILGQAEVKNVFKVSNVGLVAGCYVNSGEIQRGANVRVIRDDIVVYTGTIKTLRRFKDDVKSVKNNYECGICVDNYLDIKEKDILECYEIVEQKREL